MKNLYLISVISSLLCSEVLAQIPDTVTNRFATQEDADYWNNVNVDDYIFFKGNINIEEGQAINNQGSNSLSLALGKKYLIWKGKYLFITLDGQNCQNSEEQPTIVTNLGGQVEFGYYEDPESTRRTLELFNFDHLFLSGKHDPEKQTGHQDYKGHNDGKNMGSPNYYEKYGIWGHPLWSDIRFRNDEGVNNIVRIRDFETLKVEYVAATEGGFAGFNIKSDNPPDPERVKVNIQDCFAGWTEGEGYYIGYSSNASNNDFNELIFRNNIAVFTGAEAFQTDNLSENSIFENNIALSSGAFYRRPFMDKFQDGLQQISFVEGGVTVQNNIMTGGDLLHTIRHKDPGANRAFPDANKKVVFTNNYYGYTRSNVSYVWEGDGITPYEITNSYYGNVATEFLVDSYNDSEYFNGIFRLCNETNPILFSNLTVSEGRQIAEQSCGNAIVTETEINRTEPELLDFVNLGFPANIDFRKITYWTSRYKTADKLDQFVPYEVGEYVFYPDDITGSTAYYKCIQAHEGEFNPKESPSHWEKIEWNGQDSPPLDIRLKAGSFYETRGIGLSYPGVPYLVLSEEEVNFGVVDVGLESDPIQFEIESEVLGNIDIEASNQLLVSSDNSNFSENITLTPSNSRIDQSVYVKYLPTEEGTFEGTISIATSGLEPKVIQVSGSGRLPSLETSISEIDFGIVDLTLTSDTVSYTIAAAGIISNLEVEIPKQISISTDNSNFSSDNLILSPDNDNEINTTVFFFFEPINVSEYSASIIHKSTNLEDVSIDILAVGRTPDLTTSLGSLSFDEIAINAISDEQSYTLSGEGIINDISISVTDGFEIRTETGAYTDQISIGSPESRIIDQEIFVRFNPNSVKEYSGFIYHYTPNEDSITIELSGVAIDPALSVFLKSADKIYPNPSSGTLTVSFLEEYDGDLLIMDSNGRLIKKVTITNGFSTFELAPSIKEGIYLLQYSKKGELISHKFFIKKN